MRVDGGTYRANKEVVVFAIDDGTVVEVGDGVLVPGAGDEGAGVQGGLGGGGEVEVEEDLVEDFRGKEHHFVVGGDGIGRRKLGAQVICLYDAIQKI